MQSRRLARISELVTQTISQSALSLKDPGLGFVTFTGSKVAPDLSLARVFYSVLGTPEEQGSTAQALERARPYFRSQLARLENFRKVPQISFVYDESLGKADRVNQILTSLQNEKSTEGSNDSSH